MNSDSDKLEQLIGGVLRDQPLRHAPASVELRVLAAIEAGTASAGWKRGFVHWPLMARAAFILASVGVVKFALLAMSWTLTVADPSAHLAGAAAKLTWIKVLAEVVFAAVRSIPEHWLWSLFVIVAAVYAAFFTISAIAYRTLYASQGR